MSAIGIDFGSSKAVMAVVGETAGIKIVLSDTSNRSVPVMVAYTSQERMAGESVKSQLTRNYKNSIVFPTRFLGLNAACAEQLKIEERYITHTITSASDGRLLFPINDQ